MASSSISCSTTRTTPRQSSDFKFSQVDVVPWCLGQYVRYIYIEDCNALSFVIPSYAVGQMQKLEELEIQACELLVEVFESQGINYNSTNIDEGSGGTDTTLAITRIKYINVPQLSNLKKLQIVCCDLLQHVFTFSTLESLVQLQELEIRLCDAMKVIVKEENGEQTMTSTKVVVFPRLMSIQLFNLPNLTGFSLGMDEFQWPLLNDVKIVDCPQMMVFTSGLSISPKLNYIQTSVGKHSLECGLNSFHFQGCFFGCCHFRDDPLSTN